MGSAMSRLGIPSSAEAYSAALEGLTNLDADIIGHGGVPPLYLAGVKYSLKPHAIWRHADDVATQGWGDCEDLSTYRAGELRVSGEDPGAKAVVYPTGVHRYHAVVMRGDGQIEDPSAVLGMTIRRPDLYVKHIRDNFGHAAVGEHIMGLFDDVGRASSTPGRASAGLATRHGMRGFATHHEGKAARKARRLAAAPPKPAPSMDADAESNMDTSSLEGDSCCVVGEDIAPEAPGMTFDIFKTPSGGFTGVMRLPMNNGNALYAKTSHSKTPHEAAKKGAKMAGKVAASLKKTGAKKHLTPHAEAATDIMNSKQGQAALTSIAASKLPIPPQYAAAYEAGKKIDDLTNKLPGPLKYVNPSGVAKQKAGKIIKKMFGSSKVGRGSNGKDVFPNDMAQAEEYGATTVEEVSQLWDNETKKWPWQS